MKRIVLALGLTFATAAHAQIAESDSLETSFKSVPLCSGPVTADATRVARVAGRGQIAVTGTGAFESFDLFTDENVVALELRDSTLWVLLPDKIQEWDLRERKLMSETPTATGISVASREAATGMDWSGNNLVIAHGRLGYAVFNTDTRTVIERQAVLENQKPLGSALTGVTVLGDRALFTVDNFSVSPDTFRGFLLVDLRTAKVVQSARGLDAGSVAVNHFGDTVMVGFDGPVQSFRLSEILGRPSVRAIKAVSTFPKAGHPIGRPAIVGTKVFTCFLAADAPGAEKTFVPMVLDLSLFQL